jgi:hypothetical protein
MCNIGTLASRRHGETKGESGASLESCESARRNWRQHGGISGVFNNGGSRRENEMAARSETKAAASAKAK